MRNSIRIWEAPGELHSNLEASEGTKEVPMAQKELPTNYEELLQPFLGLPMGILEVPATKNGEGGKFLDRRGGPPGITPPLGQSFKGNYSP